MQNAKYGMLSDKDIRKYFGNGISIYTEDRAGDYCFDLEKQLQLASIDLRFRNDCKRFKSGINGNLSFEMLKNHAYTDPFEIANSELLVIQPGEIIFTTTLETICISNEFAGIITGRSSFARMGIMVHCCQEFVNPGQGSPIALQIINMGKYPVELDMSIPICQLVLFKLSTPASELYSQKATSKYKDEKEVMDTRVYEESSATSKAKRTPKKAKVRPFFKKMIAQFAPPIIVFLFIQPVLVISQTSTVSALGDQVMKTPISIIILLIAIVLFIICGRDED